MLSFFRKKEFKPEFPIIELGDSPEAVKKSLLLFSNVEKVDDSEDKDIDFCYFCEKCGTRIHVGFSGDKIQYINYLTQKFNETEKLRTEKLKWFLNHYGKPDEYGEPKSTGYMIIFHNQRRNLSIVLGLHLGPIRVNNLANT